ncbi:acyl-CoA dehydrogenase [Mycobacterium vulneris]|uniref:acyl-CoA dehydrogenase family protein n=1 Tax=Mycolicibacterium porcinum TaxID=39693 RepID=UPI00080ACF1D|nr:acyl-CoA dehydrogenase family protein [Mycolicibacterium porcinum]OCB10007.1 acyl-CoA dehydrogenase [Mycolicibacterium porcinum]OCB59189.1 acyl-CoA dehydrogenase [Mycolicibacterium vulneris]OCB61551.1 acyl-CoA dehydrogenase [Mycolicibacterium vulneris]
MTQNVRAAVRQALPAIAAAAAAVDHTGAVDPSVISGLHDAGFFAMLQPKAFGGIEADPAEYLAVTRDLSAACTSTGWLAGWLGVNTWHLSLFDEQAQRDVWGRDPRTLLCESYAPTGRLERVGDDFRLSGRWSRCTGILHSSWLMAAAVLVGEDGAAQDFLVALVPRADYVVESGWNSVGLRGIGAHDVVVSGAVVPRYRTFGWVSGEQLGRLAPLYRLPQPTMYTHTGTAPLLGAAENILAALRPRAASPVHPVAMACSDLELSVAQIERNLGDLMDCVRTGQAPDSDLVLRSRRDQVLASERALAAIRTFIAHSDGRDAEDLLVERVWRDVQTAQTHVASNVEQVLALVGRHSFGMEVDEILW